MFNYQFLMYNEKPINPALKGSTSLDGLIIDPTSDVLSFRGRGPIKQRIIIHSNQTKFLQYGNVELSK